MIVGDVAIAFCTMRRPIAVFAAPALTVSVVSVGELSVIVIAADVPAAPATSKPITPM